MLLPIHNGVSDVVTDRLSVCFVVCFIIGIWNRIVNQNPELLTTTLPSFSHFVGLGQGR